MFLMKSGDAAVCCDSRSDSICLSPSANLPHCNWQKQTPIITELPPCFTVGVIQGVAALSPILCCM